MSQHSMPIKSEEEPIGSSLQDDLESLDTTSSDTQTNGNKINDMGQIEGCSVKKASHRASERRRRERLSASLTSLETIIRSSKKFSSRKGLKLNKNLLIEYTIDYIKDLEEHLTQATTQTTFLTQQLNAYQDNQDKLLQSLLRAQARPAFVPSSSAPLGYDATPNNSVSPPTVKSETSSTTTSFTPETANKHSYNSNLYYNYANQKLPFPGRKMPLPMEQSVPYVDSSCGYLKPDPYNPLFASGQFPQQQNYIYNSPLPTQPDYNNMNLIISKQNHTLTPSPMSSIKLTMSNPRQAYIAPTYIESSL